MVCTRPSTLLSKARSLTKNRNQLQTNPDFQNGKFDLDGLCSELRKKAKCSESGVVVPESYVEEAFNKLGSQKKDEFAGLTFEQDHFDEALKRLGGGTYSTLPQN